MNPDCLKLLYDVRFLRLMAERKAFDPFTALRIEQYEIRHTTVLSWLLDPAATHGLGDVFLRLFLNAVLSQQTLSDPTTNQHVSTGQWPDRKTRILSDVAHGSVTVVREAPLWKVKGKADAWTFKSENEEPPKRRLDLCMFGGSGSSQWLVAIEAKVDSKEGEDQLKDYRNAVNDWCLEHGGSALCLYLTDGDPTNTLGWVNINWAQHVREPLAPVLQLFSEQGSPLHLFLHSYYKLLGKICRRDDRMMELSRDYWREILLFGAGEKSSKEADNEEPSASGFRRAEYSEVLAELKRYVDRSPRQDLAKRILDDLDCSPIGSVTDSKAIFVPKCWDLETYGEGDRRMFTYEISMPFSDAVLDGQTVSKVEVKIEFGPLGENRPLAQHVFNSGRNNKDLFHGDAESSKSPTQKTFHHKFPVRWDGAKLNFVDPASWKVFMSRFASVVEPQQRAIKSARAAFLLGECKGQAVATAEGVVQTNTHVAEARPLTAMLGPLLAANPSSNA